MRNTLKNFLRDENGASLAEYGILVALIAVIAIGTVTTLGTKINTAFNAIVTKLT